MSWISIIIGLLTYLLTSSGNKKNKGTALAAALGVGLASEWALDNTEWGAGIKDWLNPSNPGNTKVDVPKRPDGITDEEWATRLADLNKDKAKGAVDAGKTGSSSFLDTIWNSITKLPSWAIGAVGGAAVATGIPSWLLWTGAAFIGYKIFFDE